MNTPRNIRTTRYAGWAAAATVLLLLLPVLVAAGESPAGDESAQVWPLDLPEHYLTSNFMEHRPGRPHAGLDFKTRSLSGFPVRAVEDGWIARVRATPGAYGRAVYLRGESGRTFVYAHLGRFNDEIRERLLPLRDKSGVYRARLEFQPGEMPVRAGDVLGLSGQAGTNGPHLHFEVRDAAQRPLNPQTEGFAVADTFAPVIHHVRALPATPLARVGGSNEAAILEAGSAQEGSVLAIDGPVAFSAKITDRSDIRGHVLEPELIEVRLDGQVVYRSHNVAFSFDEVGRQRLEWLDLPDTLGGLACPAGRVRERWLHRRPGADLPGREGELWYLGSGGEGLAPGDHELEILARDCAGGSDRMSLILRVGGPADASSPGWRNEPVEYPLQLDDRWRMTPLFVVQTETSDGPFRTVLRSEEGDPVLAPTPAWIWIEFLNSGLCSVAAAQGLVEGTSGSVYVAADWPLNAALAGEVATAIDRRKGPSRDERRGVYRWDSDEWDYAGPVLASDDDLSTRGRITERGLHAVFTDERAPAVGPPADSGEKQRLVVGPGPASPDPAVTLPRWAIFPVRLLDEGSGVAPETIRANLDGRPLVVEPDLIRDRALVELPDDVAVGEHVLYLSAADEGGNRTETEILIDCQEESP